MKKVSKSDYYHFLACIETLKSEKACKDEKDRATTVVLNIIKPYMSKK